MHGYGPLQQARILLGNGNWLTGQIVNALSCRCNNRFPPIKESSFSAQPIRSQSQNPLPDLRFFSIRTPAKLFAGVGSRGRKFRVRGCEFRVTILAILATCNSNYFLQSKIRTPRSKIPVVTRNSGHFLQSSIH